MEALKFSKNKRHKGLHLYCKKCGYQLSNVKSKLKTTCKHPAESQVYKAVLLDNKGKRHTRQFDTREYDTAINQLISFKNEIAQNTKIITLVQSIKEDQSMLLLDCMAMVLDFRAGVNTPKHLIRKTTDPYKDASKQYLKAFVDFLILNKVEINSLKIDQINQDIVGNYCEYLDNKKKSPTHFNKHINEMKYLYNHLIKYKDYKISNSFAKVVLKQENKNTGTFTPEQIINLVRSINNTNGVQIYKPKTKKNRYRPWLINAIILASLTGRRREELFNMKWSDIITDENGIPTFIDCIDLKATRLKNKSMFQDEVLVKVLVPIFDTLRDFLYIIGFDQNIGTDSFIIGHDGKLTIDTLMDILSDGVNFYWGKLYPSSPLRFKNLRKTYFTTVEIVTLGRTIDISNHTSSEVLKNHYLNKENLVTSFARNNHNALDSLNGLNALNMD